MKSFAYKYDKINKVITGIGGMILIVNIVIVIANIILRRVFNAPIFGSTEYVQYISLIVGALGLCQNEWYNGNVTMTLVLEKVSAKTADILRLICSIVSTIGFTYVSILMVNDVFAKMAKDVVTNTLKMPKWIFVAILAFGVIMLTITIFVKMLMQIHYLRTGERINVMKMDPEEETVQAE